MIKIGIIGGTGYTGVELLRLLAQHPNAELKVITSRGEAGRRNGAQGLGAPFFISPAPSRLRPAMPSLPCRRSSAP